MSSDEEIAIVDQLCSTRDLPSPPLHVFALPSSFRMLAYGLYSTAHPQEILMGWYQRPRLSSPPWVFFITTVLTQTLRCLSFISLVHISAFCSLFLAKIPVCVKKHLVFRLSFKLSKWTVLNFLITRYTYFCNFNTSLLLSRILQEN